MSELIALLPLAAVLGAWLLYLTLAAPRALLYVTIAAVPAQAIFVPVSSFFLSPADVLVTACALGLAARLMMGQRSAWVALYQHRYVGLMLVAYLVGFVVLDVSSRTLVRLPLAVVVSIAACDLLRSRAHLARAGTALIVAGAIDAGYGLYFVARGTPLHPTRFEGMSDVNFGAMLFVAAAAIALAKVGTSRALTRLVRPGALAAAAFATLSQMGGLALAATWVMVLRRHVSRLNKTRIAMAAVTAVAIALALPQVRERLASRNARQVEADGVARSSFDVRVMILDTAWRAFERSPVLGVGYFQFQRESNAHPEIRRSTAGGGYPTHNTYVEVLVEGGLVGFALFVWHWRQYVTRLASASRWALRRRDSAVVSALVGLPVVAVSAALANLLLMYSFWAICGLALAALSFVSREQRAEALQSGGRGVS